MSDNMASIVIFFVIICIFLTFFYITYDNSEVVYGREIRILIGTRSSSPLTLIEFGESNNIYIASIAPLSSLAFFNAELYEKGRCEWSIFDISLLDDFFLQSRIIRDSILIFGPVPIEPLPLDRLVGYLQPVEYVIIDEWVVELTREQVNLVNRLTQGVVDNGICGEFRWNPNIIGRQTHAWAIIDGKMYWSLINAREPALIRMAAVSINWSILTLLDEIVDLSPHPVF